MGELHVGEIRVHVSMGERPIATQYAYTRGKGRETGVVDTHHLTRAQAAELYARLGQVLGVHPPPTR